MNATDKEHTVRLFTNGGYFLTSRRDGNFGAVTVTEVSQASFNPSLLKVVACPTNTVFHSLAKSPVASRHVISNDQCNIV